MAVLFLGSQKKYFVFSCNCPPLHCICCRRLAENAFLLAFWLRMEHKPSVRAPTSSCLFQVCLTLFVLASGFHFRKPPARDMPNFALTMLLHRLYNLCSYADGVQVPVATPPTSATLATITQQYETEFVFDVTFGQDSGTVGIGYALALVSYILCLLMRSWYDSDFYLAMRKKAPKFLWDLRIYFCVYHSIDTAFFSTTQIWHSRKNNRLPFHCIAWHVVQQVIVTVK